MPGHATHSRNSSADLNKSFRNEVGLLFGVQAGAGAMPWVDPLRVRLVTGHHSCLAVAYKHFVAVYRSVLTLYTQLEQQLICPG